MSQFIHIRRVGATLPGWYHDVDEVPRTGDLLAFGCAHGEKQATAETQILANERLWRVQAVIHHYLCATEAENDPRASCTIEVLVSPLQQHEWVLVTPAPIEAGQS